VIVRWAFNDTAEASAAPWLQVESPAPIFLFWRMILSEKSATFRDQALAFLARAERRQHLFEQEAELQRLELDANAPEPELQIVVLLP
jgi:hypothetical protein